MKIRFAKHFAITTICAFFFLTACNDTQYETCSDQLKCTAPPLDDKASESLKKLRADISGKWKLASIKMVNEILKTDSTYKNIRNSMCISYNGGIAFFKNNQDFVCEYCYALDGGDGAQNLKIDAKTMSPYCEQQLQNSKIVLRNDSLMIERRDSFIVKNIIYKRADDSYNFKAN
jgi:hypothetical protein